MSDTRAALARAIAAHTAASDALVALELASSAAARDNSAAWSALERAEILLAEARSSAPHAYIAALVAGGTTNADLVTAAERELSRATAHHEMIREGRAVLAEELAAAEQRLRAAIAARRAATAELLKDRPEVAQLIASYDHARAVAAAHLGALDALWKAGALPCEWNSLVAVNRTLPPADSDLASAWAAALAALETDPDAALPAG